MEPRKIETASSRGDTQASSPQQPERKRRFLIVKLEERIAPSGPHNSGRHSHCTGCG